MKQLGCVFRFELFGYIKRKSFLTLTIILVLVVAGVLSWPRISGLFGSKDTEEPTAAEAQVVALATENGNAEAEAAYYNEALAGQGYLFQPVEANLAELQALVEGQTEGRNYEFAVLLTGPLSYTRVVQTIALYDSFESFFGDSMQARYRAETLAGLGVPQQEAEKLLAAAPEAQTVTVASGKDQAQNFFYTYILIFLLYFAIIMYGQFVASSVATEKSTRAMELLITSARPNSLIFGKVLGAGCAGITQMAVILGSAFLFYNLNSSYYQDNYLVQSIFNIPLPMLGYTLVFFVLGFFLYAFLYAGLASLVSRMEDLATAIMPITYLFIIAFMVVMFSMGSGNVDNIAMLVCSYIPLTSPMAMFTRIAMGEVAGWEIAFSVGILVVSTVGFGILSAKIYRLGVLLYGTPPKPKEIVRMLKASKNG